MNIEEEKLIEDCLDNLILEIGILDENSSDLQYYPKNQTKSEFLKLNENFNSEIFDKALNYAINRKYLTNLVYNENDHRLYMTELGKGYALILKQQRLSN